MQILAPLVFLTVIPIMVMIVIGRYDLIVFIIAILNLVGSAVDIPEAVIALIKIPNNSIVVGNCYYKNDKKAGTKVSL